MRNFFKGMLSRAAVTGNNNVTLQNVSVVHTGLTYADARQISMDIFNENFYRVSAEAATIARDRVNEFTNELLTAVSTSDPAGFDQFKDPGLQYSLFDAQKQYARYGDKCTSNLLIDLLVERTRHQKRNLSQLVVDEAIVAAGRITNEQMALLSLILVCKGRIDGFENMMLFKDFLRIFIDSILSDITYDKDDAFNEFNHLTYAGCIHTGSIGSAYSFHLQHNYELGFNFWNEQPENGFQDIFKQTFISNSEILLEILGKTENNHFITLDDFKDYGLRCGLDIVLMKEFHDKFLPHKYDNKKMAEVLEIEPFSILNKVYKDYRLSSYNLTSVGVSIARSYLRTAGLFNIE